MLQENATLRRNVKDTAICEPQVINAQAIGDFVVSEAEVFLWITPQRIRVGIHFAVSFG